MFKIRPNQSRNRFCFLLVLIFLSGCSYQNKNSEIWAYKKIEARYNDIPVCVHFKAITSDAQQLENGIIQVFETKEAIDSIRTFYLNEMEREGWKNLFVLDVQEVLLAFEKPYRYCIVSVCRKMHKKNCIKIFLNIKA